MTTTTAAPPWHPTSCSSMKLVLSAVLSLGIAGKCVLKAGWGGMEEPGPPRTTGFLPSPGCFLQEQLQHVPDQAAPKLNLAAE